MDDIFDQSEPAEVRPYVDTSKLVFEARAELNAIDKGDDGSIAARREIGRKFKEIIDAMGRGGVPYIAKHCKISESFVRGHVELYEAHPDIDRAEAMAILWGHKSRVKGGGSTAKPAVKAKPKVFWKSLNVLIRQSQAFAEEKADVEAGARIKKHLDAVHKELAALEKK